MAKNTSAWGRDTAQERYGSKPTFSPPASQNEPQSPEDQHGPGYNNDTSGWVRGAGETAENKPGFDKTRK